ncbi:MAG: Lrp/AsnC ligand binding domain-containing protein [Methanomassiliicoccales archaeon]|nr:MAG: Lrp/AsnC ligand binding domain-containing protein [Methanomassiliicoccales archaeon]
MPSAFVIINTDIGMESVVLQSLEAIEEIEMACVVYGVYDIVAKISAPDMESLERAISERLRKVAGIRSTLTLIISKEHQKR